MSWNYRIVKYANEDGYGLHEVHYDVNGSAISMTENPTTFTGDNPTEIIEALLLARVAAKKLPVFIEPKEWSTDTK